MSKAQQASKASVQQSMAQPSNAKVQPSMAQPRSPQGSKASMQPSMTQKSMAQPSNAKVQSSMTQKSMAQPSNAKVQSSMTQKSMTQSSKASMQPSMAQQPSRAEMQQSKAEADQIKAQGGGLAPWKTLTRAMQQPVKNGCPEPWPRCPRRQTKHRNPPNVRGCPPRAIVPCTPDPFWCQPCCNPCPYVDPAPSAVPYLPNMYAPAVHNKDEDDDASDACGRREKRWPQCNFLKPCIDTRIFRDGETMCSSYAGHIPGEQFVYGRNFTTASTFAKRRLCTYSPYEIVDTDGCCSVPYDPRCTDRLSDTRCSPAQTSDRRSSSQSSNNPCYSAQSSDNRCFPVQSSNNGCFPAQSSDRRCTIQISDGCCSNPFESQWSRPLCVIDM